MHPILLKVWNIVKGILSVPLYFVIGMIILAVVYYLGAYFGHDYNENTVDIVNCRSIGGTWNYSTNRCKLP
jgi:hypothetical protein